MRLLKIGLTGGIACGKSETLNYFKNTDWNTISADEIVKDLLANDQETITTIIAKFGDDALLKNSGSINRQYLASRIFNNAEDKIWLENLIHPKVNKHWTTAIKLAPEKQWIIEIPLLFEKNLESQFDFSVCIFAPYNIQVKRLLARGLTKSDAKARIASQLPLEAKLNKSDFSILNSGSHEFLRKQINQLKTHLSN